MIKFTPTFSGGASGAALLLMRTATAAALLLAAYRWLLPDAYLAAAAMLLAAGLLLGVFTRAIGILAAFLLGALAIRTGSVTGIFLAIHGIQALALALIGAGAYSIDARLFGRRVIRLDDPVDPIG